jgi:hypothetical protein
MAQKIRRSSTVIQKVWQAKLLNFVPFFSHSKILSELFTPTLFDLHPCRNFFQNSNVFLLINCKKNGKKFDPADFHAKLYGTRLATCRLLNLRSHNVNKNAKCCHPNIQLFKTKPPLTLSINSDSI